MKKSLFILSLALLLLNGCAYNVDTITEEPTESSTPTLGEFFKMASKESAQLVEGPCPSTFPGLDTLNALPEQVTKCYNLMDMSFAFVTQPNSWNALPETRAWEAEGNTAWSGLISYHVEGTWELFTKIAEEDFNPVNLVLGGSDLFLDIADDSGAGSGEGTLNRYVYSLEDPNFTPFYSWMNIGCTGYYIPETYKYEAFSCK